MNLSKVSSSILAVAVVLTSPGSGAYRAWADGVAAPGVARAGLMVQPIAAGFPASVIWGLDISRSALAISYQGNVIGEPRFHGGFNLGLKPSVVIQGSRLRRFAHESFPGKRDNLGVPARGDSHLLPRETGIAAGLGVVSGEAAPGVGRGDIGAASGALQRVYDRQKTRLGLPGESAAAVDARFSSRAPALLLFSSGDGGSSNPGSSWNGGIGGGGGSGGSGSGEKTAEPYPDPLKYFERARSVAREIEPGALLAAADYDLRSISDVWTYIFRAEDQRISVSIDSLGTVVGAGVSPAPSDFFSGEVRLDLLVPLSRVIPAIEAKYGAKPLRVEIYRDGSGPLDARGVFYRFWFSNVQDPVDERAEPQVTAETKAGLVRAAKEFLAKGVPENQWLLTPPSGARFIEVRLWRRGHFEGYQYDALVPVGSVNPNKPTPPQDPNQAERFVLRRSGGLSGHSVYSEYIRFQIAGADGQKLTPIPDWIDRSSLEMMDVSDPDRIGEVGVYLWLSDAKENTVTFAKMGSNRPVEVIFNAADSVESRVLDRSNARELLGILYEAQKRPGYERLSAPAKAAVKSFLARMEKEVGDAGPAGERGFFRMGAAAVLAGISALLGSALAWAGSAASATADAGGGSSIFGWSWSAFASSPVIQVFTPWALIVGASVGALAALASFLNIRSGENIGRKLTRLGVSLLAGIAAAAIISFALAHSYIILGIVIAAIASVASIANIVEELN